MERAFVWPGVGVAALIALGACGTKGQAGGTSSTGGSATGGRGATGAGPTTTAASSGGAGGGATCSGADVFVAPDGTGTACSCTAPCALETGRDHARALAPSRPGDLVVQLRGGVYRLGHTFALTAADSGVNGAIVYRAAPGEAPLLSGAVAVTGFAPATTPAGAYVATVPAGTHARQLWVNGRRATRARGPDLPAGYVKTATGFTLGDAAMAGWPDRAGLEVVGTQAWKMFRCPVTDVAAAGVTIAAPCWSASQMQAGYTFDTVGWVENAIELLDARGEFHLDDAGGKLYYLPRDGEDLASADVELPVLEQILLGQGDPASPLHDVSFEGIGFAHATWTGPSTPDGYAPLQAGVTMRGSPPAQQKTLANVTFHAAHRIRLQGCGFSHLGGAALAFEVGAQDNVVTASRFDDVSGSAVIVGDVTHTEDHHPTDPRAVVSGNTVERSFIARAGVEYFDAPGLFVGYTTRTSLVHNDLFDLPYTGISVGWGWGGVDPGGGGGYATPSTSHDNDIRGNRIGHHMRRLRDGGAIYVLGAQLGSVIAENVIDNQANAYGNLYLDNGTAHFSVSGNVVNLYPKADLGSPTDPDRSYWLYVQVYAPLATSNAVFGNFTNDPTPFAPQPIDPSNLLGAPGVLTGAPSAADSIVAAAGSPLRSPNVAAGKVATASSAYDATHGAEMASNDSAFDGWSSTVADPTPWWQVDLGASYAVDAVEVVSRWAIDQPSTRRAYRVLASADASFTSPVVLGSVDRTGVPHRAIFAADVSPPVTARYVRVEKTDPEYFFLAEVRVHGQPSP